MPSIVSIESHDAATTYTITAEATGPTAATIAERKTDKATGAVTNSSYDLYNVEVVNGVLKANAHAPGFQTANVEVDMSARGDSPMVSIAISHLWVGNQTLGPYGLSATDWQALAGWLSNFPRS